jgi:hypothetical protein
MSKRGRPRKYELPEDMKVAYKVDVNDTAPITDHIPSVNKDHDVLSNDWSTATVFVWGMISGFILCVVAYFVARM